MASGLAAVQINVDRFLPMFRDNQSAPSSAVKRSKKFFLACLKLEDGTDRVTEMSVITYERCMTSQKAGMSICKNI